MNSCKWIKEYSKCYNFRFGRNISVPFQKYRKWGCSGLQIWFFKLHFAGPESCVIHSLPHDGWKPFVSVKAFAPRMTPLCETPGLRPSISQPCHIHGGSAHIVLTALLLHGLFVIKLFVWHRTAVRYFLECYHLFNSSGDIRSSVSSTWGGAE